MKKEKSKRQKIIESFYDDREISFKPLMIKGIGKTSGDGLWSNRIATVPFTIELPSYVGSFYGGAGLDVYGSVSVHFSTKKWNVHKHGLIYTDTQFIKDVRNALKNYGIKNFRDVDYSEQGRQSDNYVDLDIDEKLINELIKLKVIKI